MSGAARKIETAANIAIVIAAIAIVFVAVRHYTGNRIPPRISTGAKFGVQSINWQESKKNIVLGLSTTCHFCTESAGFYRDLVKQCKEEHVRTVALFPQPVAAAQEYLNNQGIHVDEVRQAILPDLGISGTPTVLLVGDTGVVQNVWFGKLPGNVEKEVLVRARQ